MPHLILHIGLQKTGTSSMQHFLHVNRLKLRVMGIHYPLLGEFSDTRFDATAYHNCVAAALGDFPSTFPAISAGDIASLRSLILRSPVPVLLSAEEFSRTLDMSALRSFASGMQVTVLVYLRDQAIWVQSLYNQRNKVLFDRADVSLLDAAVPSAEDLHRFLRVERYGPLLAYDAVIERWRTIGTVLARPFNSARFPMGLLVYDFLEALGLQPAPGLEMPPRSNESLANTWIRLFKDVCARLGPEAAQTIMRVMSDHWRRGEIDLSGDYTVFDKRQVGIMRDRYEPVSTILKLVDPPTGETGR